MPSTICISLFKSSVSIEIIMSLIPLGFFVPCRSELGEGEEVVANAWSIFNLRLGERSSGKVMESKGSLPLGSVVESEDSMGSSSISNSDEMEPLANDMAGWGLSDNGVTNILTCEGIVTGVMLVSVSVVSVVAVISEEGVKVSAITVVASGDSWVAGVVTGRS